MKSSEKSKNILFKWIYQLITFNIDLNKSNYDTTKTSSLGFLLNITYILIKVLYDNKLMLETCLFKFASRINPLFVLMTDLINYNKFDKINNDAYNEMTIKNNLNNNHKFNLETQFFFTVNSIISLVIKQLQSDYISLSNKYDDFATKKPYNDSLFNEIVCVKLGYEVYLKNVEFCKNLLIFTNINIDLFFILNNTKYTSDFLISKNVQDNKIIDDFTHSFDNSENKSLSILPFILVQNIINVYICLRIIHPEVLIRNMFSVKLYAYFSIIYSSNPNFLIIPHFRLELLDLILFLFSVRSKELKLPGCKVI